MNLYGYKMPNPDRNYGFASSLLEDVFGHLYIEIDDAASYMMGNSTDYDAAGVYQEYYFKSISPKLLLPYKDFDRSTWDRLYNIAIICKNCISESRKLAYEYIETKDTAILDEIDNLLQITYKQLPSDYFKQCDKLHREATKAATGEDIHDNLVKNIKKNYELATKVYNDIVDIVESAGDTIWDINKSSQAIGKANELYSVFEEVNINDIRYYDDSELDDIQQDFERNYEQLVDWRNRVKHDLL